ncbi:hypothetical protein ACW0KB_12030 [Virgibacillus salarius]
MKSFKDKYSHTIYRPGQEVTMTVKRGNEAITNLQKWDGKFLERIDKRNNKGEDK